MKINPRIIKRRFLGGMNLENEDYETDYIFYYSGI